MTTDRGTNGALSSVFGSVVADPSGAMTWPKMAGLYSMSPTMARAYGSSSNFDGLHRSPSSGRQGPCTR
jgi:hypothetical protein